jgi:SAM-dependent methyltransferase
MCDPVNGQMTSASDAAANSRIVQHFPPGSSTATKLNLDYRLKKLADAGLLHGRWLDYGCAQGDYTSALVAKGADCAIGYDVVAERINEARIRHQKNPRVEFHTNSTGLLPLDDNSVDNAFVNEVMEHVTDEASALRELHRVIRPGGHLVVISPNRWFPFECHGAKLGGLALPFPVPLLPWLPKALGQRFMEARNYWPSELAGLVAAHGFRVRPVRFVWPVLEVYPWLPRALTRFYQKRIGRFDRLPIIRRFGVSTLVIGDRI